MSNEFRALVLRQDDNKKVGAAFETLVDEDLPSGEVTIEVHYSGLNYKDGLAVSGKGKIARSYPMVAGIDLAGIVTHSSSPDFTSGQEVLACGGGMSETMWGGYAEKARLPADIVVPLPDAFDLEQSMAIGTAGFTSMLCVIALEQRDVTPDKGPVVVTGAGGGVGSVAIALLSRLGYEVVAVSGRETLAPYFKTLGAARTLPRTELDRDPKPLESEIWAGAVDSVGSRMLATVLAQTKSDGAVAACGLAGGPQLATTVMPFILRGVSLIGVNSVVMTAQRRRAAWQRLAQDLDVGKLAELTHVISLDDVPDAANKILAGEVRGRTVVSVRG